MITRKLIERIEGEAEVDFELNGRGGVDFATIRFPHIRGMEKIMRGRGALDALVISPRVCGICGHSHLMATVRAIEDAFVQAGVPVQLSPKASEIREITLMLELVQNHLKWFYLVIGPELSKLSAAQQPKSVALKGAYAAALANKALAVFSGQWPHSSYAVPGGVTCDPTHLDIVRAEAYLDDLVRFFEKEFAGICLDYFLTLRSCKEFNGIQSDMADVERMLTEASMHEKGFAADRFMVLGEHEYAVPAKVIGTALRRCDPDAVSVASPFTPGGRSEALNALYKGSCYETGPLARAMAKNTTLIKNIHRRFKDSAYTRVMARIYETGQLIYRIKTRLNELDLSYPSYTPPPIAMKELSGSGKGIIEAPRGTLLHRLTLQNGLIADYEMITPTQWNLGSGTKTAPGIAQQAMIGSAGTDEASFIFRTFDVCSVCTTH